MSEAVAHLGMTDITAAIAAQQVSAEEVVRACLHRVDDCNDQVNAFTAVYAERALAKAQRVDEQLRQGVALPLAGVPFAVKNLFDVAAQTTVAGSKILDTNAAAAADALLVQRLEAQGAVLVGSLNMGEFAYDFTGEINTMGPAAIQGILRI